MPFALNIQKGTIIKHPDIGELHGGTAKEIDSRFVHIAKHLYNVVVFDDIEKKASG